VHVRIPAGGARQLASLPRPGLLGLKKHYILLVRASERITDEKAKETITRVMCEELCVLKGGPSAVEYVMKSINEAT
jgi:hypothetical protein